VAKNGIAGGALLIVGAVAFPIVYMVVAYPQIGIWVLMVMAYTLFLIMSIGIKFPFWHSNGRAAGTVILGFFIHQRNRPDWQGFERPNFWPYINLE